MNFETLVALELAEDWEGEELISEDLYLEEDLYKETRDDVEDLCDEYVFDEELYTDEDIEPELTDVITDNDDAILPDAVGLGIALGLAEEIAVENKYREMDNTANQRAASERDLPKGSILVPFKKEAKKT